MSFQNENQSQNLEMKAKCVLNDISNQQDRKTKFNWISQSNSDKKSSIKLPSLSTQKHQQKKQFKYTPWLIRRKGNLYREKINELLNDVQKDANFPLYQTNIKLTNSSSKENDENSTVMSKKRNYQKCTTQNNQEGDQNSKIYHTSFLLKNKGFDNESKLKKNWSVHVRKALATLNRQKESMNKQIQSIKSLIEDKRTKCRMLSKQGYLIVKQQPQNNGSRNFNSSIQILGERNKNIERNKIGQKSSQRSSLSILPTESSFQNVSKCKSFLTNAYQIISSKHSQIQF